MQIVIDIPTPPSEQRIINVPIHFCGGQVVDAGGYGFEERKTGKWIITARNGVLCSECKSGTRRMPMLFGNPLFKYCPFCGVKMEGVEE